MSATDTSSDAQSDAQDGNSASVEKPLVGRIPKKYCILVFLVLLAAFSSVGYFLTIELALRRYYIAALMWSPGLAALATCKLCGMRISVLGWKWGQARWQWYSYFIPIFYGLVAYGFIWLAGIGGVIDPRFLHDIRDTLGLSGWSDLSVVLFAFAILGIVDMIWHTGTALGEEIGWRGFLTPQLMRHFSFPVTSLIVGLIWAAWHAPLVYLTKYNAGPYDLNLQMLNFTIMCIGMSFVMTYLRLKSGSVWTAAILHAAHNAFALILFDRMTIKYEETRLYSGEFGMVLPIVVVLLGAYFWYRARNEGLTAPRDPEE